MKRRFTKGLTFDANWTWSHSIDDASDPGTTLNEVNLPQDVYNMAAEKASFSFDRRHRVVVSFVYQLPFAPNPNDWIHAALGNWQVGGYFTAQSGAPFTVNISSDQASIGAGPAQRPMCPVIRTAGCKRQINGSTHRCSHYRRCSASEAPRGMRSSDQDYRNSIFLFRRRSP